MMWRRLLVAVLLPFVGSAGQQPKAPGIEFFLTDNFGNAITAGMIHIVSDGGTSSYRITYPENSRVVLPAGRYSAVVEASGFLR